MSNLCSSLTHIILEKNILCSFPPGGVKERATDSFGSKRGSSITERSPVVGIEVLK